MKAQIPPQLFFVTGGALKLDDQSYVKRPADDELLQAASAGQYCVVLTPRQMGKTSLTVRTERRLQERGVLTANIDITSIGKQQITIHQWYYSFFFNLNDKLNLSIDIETWIRQQGELTYPQLLFNFIEEIVLRKAEKQVVVFVDEIDSMQDVDFKDDFFACLRSVYNERARKVHLSRISFVFLGVASPSDLIKDTSRTPFNIGTEISLQPFSRQDAQILERGLEQVYPKQGKKIFDRVYYWTNGHPYLTQKICQLIAEHNIKTWDDHEVDKLVANSFLSKEARHETNLQFIRDAILKSPLRASLLGEYKKILRRNNRLNDKTSLPQNQLKLLGLVSVNDNYVSVSNPIYHSVFSLKWATENTQTDWRNYVIAIFLFMFGVIGSIYYHDNVYLSNRVDKLQGCILNPNRSSEQLHCLREYLALRPIFSVNYYESEAKQLFFTLPTFEQQEKIFFPKENNPQEVEFVIKNLYVGLADIDGSQKSTRLLEVMQTALEVNNLKDSDLYLEIQYWIDARSQLKQGNIEDALMQYDNALSKNEENAAVLYERAMLFVRGGNFEFALSDFDRAIMISSMASELAPTPTQDLNTASVQSITPALTLMNPTELAIIELTSQASQGNTSSSFPADTNIYNENEAIRSQFFSRNDQISVIRNTIQKNSDLVSSLNEKIQNYPNLEKNNVAIPNFAFSAVSKEDTSCFLDSSIRANILLFQVVTVVGRNASSDWILVRVDGLPADCWVKATSLEVKGNVDLLPVISTLMPPLATFTDTPQILIATVDPAMVLRVATTTKVVNCECNGVFGSARITIFFLNGNPPFNISGQKPVDDYVAEFDVPLGSGDLNLVVTSSDGLRWEGIVKIPTTCEPQADCGGQDPKPPEPPPTDTPEPPWCQFFPQLCD